MGCVFAGTTMRQWQLRVRRLTARAVGVSGDWPRARMSQESSTGHCMG